MSRMPAQTLRNDAAEGGGDRLSERAAYCQVFRPDGEHESMGTCDLCAFFRCEQRVVDADRVDVFLCVPRVVAGFLPDALDGRGQSAYGQTKAGFV